MFIHFILFIFIQGIIIFIRIYSGISLGISMKEMAVMLLLLPIVSSIGPPLGGWLADRLGGSLVDNNG